MYLANDVIQNSKKKGPEYGREFLKVLPKAFQHIGECCANDEKTLGSLSRILNIWEERGVYDSKAVKEFRDAVQPAATSASAATSVGSTPALEEDLHSNGSDSNELGAALATKRKANSAIAAESLKDSAVKRPKSSTASGATDQLKLETTVEVNGAVEKHVVLSQHEPAGAFRDNGTFMTRCVD